MAALAGLPQAPLEPLTPRLQEGHTDLLVRLVDLRQAMEPVRGLPERDHRDLMDISPTMPRRNE